MIQPIVFREFGQTVTGRLTQSRSVKLKAGTVHFRAMMHYFKYRNKKFKIVGSATLNELLHGVDRGTMLRITYDGWKQSRMGRYYKLFTVEYRK